MKAAPIKVKYGPYALIAGGSDGLGFAYAEAIAKRGLNLTLMPVRVSGSRPFTLAAATDMKTPLKGI